MPIYFPPSWPSNYASTDPKYNAEYLVYNWFNDLPDNWIVYYDINNYKFKAAPGSSRSSKPQSQIDFLIVAPDLGVFVLEVKGGQISLRNGQWYSRGNNNEEYHIQDPIQQANDNCWSLLTFLKIRDDELEEKTHTNRVLCLHGAIFPHSYIDENEFDCLQYESYQFLTQHGYKRLDRQGLKLKDWFEQFAQKYKSKQPYKRKGPTVKQANFIKDILLPNTFSNSSIANINLLEDDIERATIDQIKVLQYFPSPRLVIQGPAGSGKSILALQEAFKLASEGERVLLICYNKNLMQYLNACKIDYFNRPTITNPDQLSDNLQITTIHALLYQITDVANKDEFDHNYLFDELPNLALRRINDGIYKQKYDVLIIDEAQDLFYVQIYEVLNQLLKGGFQKGKWRIYLDLLQYIYAQGSAIQEFDSIKSKFFMKDQTENFGLIHLKQVVRYGSGTYKFIKVRFGLDDKSILPNYIKTPDVYIKQRHSNESAMVPLNEILEILHNDQLSGRTIVILSPLNPSKNQSSILYKCLQVESDNKFPYKLCDGSKIQQVADDEIRVCSIHSFKGLESNIVILIDVNKNIEATLAYTGLTRAKYQTYVILNDSFDFDFTENVQLEDYLSLLFRR